MNYGQAVIAGYAFLALMLGYGVGLATSVLISIIQGLTTSLFND